MPLKVLTVVGTRPEVIKLSCVIPALDRAFRHTLVHTGQNYDYELNQIFFEGLGIRRPDLFLKAAGRNAVQTIANVLLKVDPVLEACAPDALLVLGDTNSCLSVIAAKRRKIPVFHMEAGNRCFDDRIPEEINRRIVDHVSDINLPYSEHARRYLLDEGIRPETIIKTGSPMKEVLTAQSAAIRESRALQALDLTPGRFVVASVHREENVDDPARLRLLLDAIESVAKRFRVQVIFSTHPRTRARLKSLRRKASTHVRFLRPMGFADYVSLQTKALCTVSDSGTITEEASILGFPAVMLREAHERPEGMDQGTLAMSGLDPRDVVDSVALTVARFRSGPGRASVVPDYDASHVSSIVVNAIQSYAGYVDRVVWRKR